MNDIAASTTGAMTILKQFYNYIRAHDSENEWIFFLGDNFLEETEQIKVICFPEVKASGLKKVWFDCFYGRKVIESFQPDVVVSLQNIITFGVKAPQIVYVHQSIPFQKTKKFSFLKKGERSTAFVQYFIGAFVKASIKKADVVFVQTQWMKKAVLESTRIPATKIQTAFPEIELFEPDTVKFDNRRFFYPTAGSIYKNNSLIVAACNLLNAEGIDDFEVRLTLPKDTIIHKNIRCIGRLDRNQMLKEYQSGTLLFPSYIETVGLPLLEARSCQTMIFAANTAFAGECLENYGNAQFFNPFCAVELKKLMEDIILHSVNLHNYEHECCINNKPSWDRFLSAIEEVGRQQGEIRGDFLGGKNDSSK